ncbi:type II CRISPR RNA-guided endonuclease Cas9 (plasmid) [Nicoliella spurrieriana]|uniref:CRISPR-associated endonuclease Cas9 n=1 Tax=Nicoliella spurrieriana TaxID=2925830 RepID=A0A976X4M9_9LACO|nr:type II CRISPR RNA-guided endonuclease Cas9 [Nicoliella spurrieriana]UQS85965.1 type II CRISPR RNA-guided endonuclease Cas9 [Nicoliella spurrieriana]
MADNQKKYHIGLDIGTNSVGFAAIDDTGQLVRKKGKTIIGARLFKEGETAAERRTFRTTRRRLKRRKWRLHMLDAIFDDEISKIDSTFFLRMKDSNLVPSDKNRHFKGSLLFPEVGDSKFNQQYPTIYHLRFALMNEHKKFDLRSIYLAMHHIIKYRGNFLDTTPVSQFNSQKTAFNDFIEQLNFYFNTLFDDSEKIINESNGTKVESELLNTNIKNYDKQKDIVKLMDLKQDDKAFNKITTNLIREISKAILGYGTKLNLLLNLPVDPKDKDRIKELTVELGSEDIDAKLEELVPDLDDNQRAILDIIRKWYAQVTLNQIIPNGMGLSESMIKKYHDHAEHLKLYKQLINNLDDAKKQAGLETAYDKYIHNKRLGKINREEFYKEVRKNLDDSELAQKIGELIEKDNFMPKQRTSDNGVIPHQFHQIELRKIIDNQKQYYPFLGELNPNHNRDGVAHYKIEELVAFHIPYYVGPLITKEEQLKTSGKQFAWMVRKSNGAITPWNFDQKVDRMASATAFIKRMTTKDSYLIGEDVLPDESLIYQKFKVLNELNMVKINGSRISVADKQRIFEDLFKTQKTVTVKKLQNYLNLPKVEITGLSDPKKFNNNLGTYNDFKKIFGSKIDDPNLQSDFENMIEWSTVFESRDIYRAKLNEISWLSDDQINKLVNKRYRGWGRLSKKLLVGLKNQDGERVLDQLWNTNSNFMQIQSQPDFATQIEEANGSKISKIGPEKILDDTYTSPQNKKAIRQVMLVVEDIKNAMGSDPASISIEFTRSPADKAERTKSRANKIRAAYRNVADEIANSDLGDELETAAKSKRGITDKLFLYFTQLGRDMYTGEPINIDHLEQYDIDHILPQSFVKDDSLSNRVLVRTSVNNKKSDNVPNEMFGKKMGSFWRYLQSNGLINKRKLKHLTMNPDNVDKYSMRGFVQRQLVETSQVIKLTANILNEIYPDSHIIEVTAKMNHQLRLDFDFIKNRLVNDYHHAFDAYLTVFAGTYLYRRYPKLKAYFVYGENQFNTNDRLDLRRFNFLHDLYLQDLSKIDNQDYYGVVKQYRDLLIHKANEIYEYQFMLTTHEVTVENGAMFKQRIYPARSARNGSKKNLIPIKSDKSIYEYGGYSHNNDSYMAVVRIKDKRGNKYKVVGVKRRWLDQLKQLSGLDYNKALRQLLLPEFTNKKGTKQFEIVVGRIFKNQLIIDGQDKFTLGTSAYKYNAKQLVLSSKSIQTLSNANDLSYSDLSKAYDDVYQEIINKMDKYMPLYDSSGIRNGFDLFKKLPNKNEFNGSKKITSGKFEILTEILNGLHANSKTGKLKEIGLGTPLGQMQTQSGVILSEDAIICYQSPTGLFERKIRLKDL